MSLRLRLTFLVACLAAALVLPSPAAIGAPAPRATDHAAAASPHRNRISPDLAMVLQHGGYPATTDMAQIVAGHRPGDVYVMAKAHPGVDTAAAAEAVAAAGATVRQRFDSIGWIAYAAPVRVVSHTVGLKQLERLQLDRVLEVLAINTTTPRFADQAKRGTSDMGADVLWRAGITGEGVKVGVSDTGIDQTHPDIGPKTAGFADCTRVLPTFLRDPDRATTCTPMTGYDDHGHGSHVSGIAAGAGAADRSLPGVAPGASLLGAKVCLAAGSCLNSSVMAGLEWLAAAGADVVNISLGSGRFYFAGAGGAEQVTNADPEAQLVNRLAMDHNIVFTISAGNSGPVLQSLGAPAVASQSIAVGASVSDFDRDHSAEETQHGVLGNIRPEAAANNASAIAQFSSRGPSGDRMIKPELTAPGSFYVAAETGQVGEVGAVDAAMGHHYSDDTQYAVLSGTSMSAPAAAGAAALVIDAYRQATGRDPQWYEVKAALANTATTNAFEGSVTGLLSGLRARYIGEDPAVTFPLRNDEWVGTTGEGTGRIWAPAAVTAATSGVIVFTQQDGAIDSIHELQPNWAADDVRAGQTASRTFTLRGGPAMPEDARVAYRVESGPEADGVRAAPASWFKLPRPTSVSPADDAAATFKLNVPRDAQPGHYTADVVARIAIGTAVQTVRIPVQFFVPISSGATATGPIWASDPTDYSALGWASPLGDIYTDWTLIPLHVEPGTKQVDVAVWDVNAADPSHMDVFVFNDHGVEVDSTVSFWTDNMLPGGLAYSGTPPDDPATVSVLDGDDLEDVDLSNGTATLWLAVSNTGPATAPGWSTYGLKVDVVR